MSLSDHDYSQTASMWNERYAAHPWSSEPDANLVELVEPLAPGRALDLGCGTGRNAVWLARQGWRVTGVDASSVGLAQAQSRAQEGATSLTLVEADLLTYQPPALSFDLVVVANIHVAPEQRADFFARAASALAPGGRLFVIGHHLDSLGRAGPPDPERLYTIERLEGLVPTLRIERLERREYPGGPGEVALADVVLWATTTDGASELSK